MSTTALATISDTLRVLIERLSASIHLASDVRTRSRFILSGAALVVVLKVLLGPNKPKTEKYVSNLEAVEKEYDIIIIGGGPSI